MRRRPATPLTYFFCQDENGIYECTDDEFRLYARVTRHQFQTLVELLKDHEQFKPPTKRRNQRPVHMQILVALYRFGSFGTHTGLRHVASRFGISRMCSILNDPFVFKCL